MSCCCRLVHFFQLFCALLTIAKIHYEGKYVCARCACIGKVYKLDDKLLDGQSVIFGEIISEKERQMMIIFCLFRPISPASFIVYLFWIVFDCLSHCVCVSASKTKAISKMKSRKKSVREVSRTGGTQPLLVFHRLNWHQLRNFQMVRSGGRARWFGKRNGHFIAIDMEQAHALEKTEERNRKC